MEGYTKFYGSLLDSSLWVGTPKELKLVWVAMLLMKSRAQVVNASVPGLAQRAGVTVEECERALGVLLAPDPHSRSPEYEGRRIEKVRGGWRILNGAYYRDFMSQEDKRIYQAEWAARKRRKKARARRGAAEEEAGAGGETAAEPGQADVEAHVDNGRFLP